MPTLKRNRIQNCITTAMFYPEWIRSMYGCSLAPTYRDFGIYPHTAASWCAVKCHLLYPVLTEHELCPCSQGREDTLSAMAGFLLMTNKSLGLNSMSAPAQKQEKLILVCNCRCSLLDRLPVSRQHSDPFCLDVLLC